MKSEQKFAGMVLLFAIVLLVTQDLMAEKIAAAEGVKVSGQSAFQL